jgi:hypothetical protein
MNRLQRRKVASLIKSGKVSSAPPAVKDAPQRPKTQPTAAERADAIEKVKLFADDSCPKCKGFGILTIGTNEAPCSCALDGAMKAAGENRSPLK